MAASLIVPRLAATFKSSRMHAVHLAAAPAQEDLASQPIREVDAGLRPTRMIEVESSLAAHPDSLRGLVVPLPPPRRRPASRPGLPETSRDDSEAMPAAPAGREVAQCELPKCPSLAPERVQGGSLCSGKCDGGNDDADDGSNSEIGSLSSDAEIGRDIECVGA